MTQSWEPEPSYDDMIDAAAGVCPSDEDLAEYLDGVIAADARARIATHAVVCDECRAIIGSAPALRDGDATPRRRRLRGGTSVAALTAAAAVLLVLLRPMAAPEDRSLERAPAAEALQFEALQPLDGAVLDRGAARFAWASAAPGAIYRLSVLDPAGELIWSVQTEATSQELPAETAATLVAGRTYYWRVESLLPDLRTSITPLHRFTVRGY